MFKESVNSIKNSLINEGNQDEIVLFKAATGSGKTTEIQNLIISSFEKNDDKIFVILFLTLHEQNNFYNSLKRKHDDCNPKIKRFQSVVRRSSVNKYYPEVDLTDLEEAVLSHYKITGIPRWMKSRLLNSQSSNTEVFLVSSIYSCPIEYSFKVSDVGGNTTFR